MNGPLIQFMNHQPRTQLRFEPSGFGGHDISRVGNVHELLHRHGIERQRQFHLPVVDTPFQLTQAADSAYEIDAFISA